VVNIELIPTYAQLSKRKDWSPEIHGFWQDEDNNWWFKIYGKGLNYAM
jgi:hypothetical protein